MKNKIIYGLVMMVLISSVAVAINTYGDDISISGYYTGKTNTSRSSDWYVWYDNGVAYAESGRIGQLYSGTNNSTVLQYALDNATIGSDTKLLSEYTLLSNISVPHNKSFSGNMGLMNRYTSMKLYLHENATINLGVSSRLSNLYIQSLHLNYSENYGGDYVSSKWNGTAISSNNAGSLIEYTSIIGFRTAIVLKSTTRIEHINIDAWEGIMQPSPVYDVSRITDVHMWTFATNQASGSLKDVRHTGIYFNRCDACFVDKFFMIYALNGIIFNNSGVPSIVVNYQLDGMWDDGVGIKLLNGSVIGIYQGYTTSATNSTSVYIDETSKGSLVGSTFNGGTYGVYVEGNNTNNTFVGVSTNNVVIDYHYNNTNLYYNGSGQYAFSNGVFYGTFDSINLTAQDTVSATTLKSNNLYDSINYVVDGSGVSPDTGVQTGDIEVANACDIEAARFKADQSGDLAVAILKASYNGTFSEIGTMSMTANTWYQDTTLSGWTTHISAGDWLRYRIDSVNSVTYATISLKCKR